MSYLNTRQVAARCPGCGGELYAQVFMIGTVGPDDRARVDANDGSVLRAELNAVPELYCGGVYNPPLGAKIKDPCGFRVQGSFAMAGTATFMVGEEETT